MVINLLGYLPHREIHNLSALCRENNVETPIGYFTDTAFVSENDLSPGVVDLISSTFAPASIIEIKNRLVDAMLQAQSAIQKAGFTCTNEIKLQVEEEDLARWTQLMVGLTAFQPETVVIRDYNNVNHTLSLAVATQMLQEVFAWGQWFFQDTWAKKDAILNS